MIIIIWILLILLFITAVVMPKIKPAVVLYATSCFALAFGLIADNILNLWLDLYGYFGKGVDLKGLAAVTATYLAVNVLYINWFPARRSLLMKGLYIAGWSIFSVIFEACMAQTAFFYHNAWHLSYSLMAYPIIFLILYGDYRLVLYLFKRDH